VLFVMANNSEPFKDKNIKELQKKQVSSWYYVTHANTKKVGNGYRSDVHWVYSGSQ
jgi:hypothetical protein